MKNCIVFLVVLNLAIPLIEGYAQRMIGDKVILKGAWQNTEIEYVKGEILIILQLGVKDSDITRSLTNYPVSVARYFDNSGFGKLSVPDSVDIFPIIEALKNNPFIKAVEPNVIGVDDTEPNDPYFKGTSPATYRYQWGLQNLGQVPPAGTPGADIHITKAWDICKGNSTDTIAILDTGIPLDGSGNLNHPDLGLNNPSRFILGPDFSSGDNDPTVRDSSSHGTHVTGIVAAETNNGVGIAGIAWNCTAIIVQVSYLGNRPIDGSRDGIIWAVNHGAKVINFSGGWNTGSEVIKQALDTALNHNVMIVASAGNEYVDSLKYPARYSSLYSNVIAVGASNQYDEKSGYSNIGPELDVVAPGGYGSRYSNDDIASTVPTYLSYDEMEFISSGYAYKCGTSMSAPTVTGLVSLVKSKFPGLSASDVKDRIRKSADDVNGYTHLGVDNYIGYGRYQCLSCTIRHTCNTDSVFTGK